MRKRCFSIVGAAFLACFGTAASGQNHVSELLDFQASNPGAAPYYVEGRMTRIYGTAFSGGASPVESADAFLAQHGDMFVGASGDLVPLAWDDLGSHELGLMRNHDTGLDKFTLLRYGQQVNGVPVFRGDIRLLVRNEEGFPLVLATVGMRELAGHNVGPNVAINGEVQTTARMRRNARALLNVPDGQQSGPARYVVWAGVEGLNATPRLAVEFVIQAGTPFTMPNYDKRLVLADASTGTVLYSETMIHNVDIQGTTSGQATQGDGADICDVEAAERLPYVRVSVQGGNQVFSDVDGEFVVTHAGNTQVNVTASLQGRYFEVFNQDGANGQTTITTPVTPPGPVDFMFNVNNTAEFDRANVNAYLHANLIRDLVLFHVPNYPTIANQVGFDVNTNINSPCNAFYDGSSINFYRATGGCSNTANSSVVYHEYGHHLVQVAGSGQDQYGEGMGDASGVVIQDQPILAIGFNNNCNAGIRNASNNIQYPCTGGGHQCGQLISGCVWETRNELVITEPADYLEIIQALTYASIPLHGPSSNIAPDITIDFLTLDDDNSNIGDGTPHYNEIATGFGEHNMDAPPLDLLDFNYPSGRPDLINPGGGVEFIVEVVGVVGDPQPGTGLLHVDSGSGFQAYAMNEITDNVYEANFPATVCGTPIRYYVSAETTTNVVQTDPEGAPTSYFTAVSATGGGVVFADTFDTNLGWTVVNENLTAGAWQRAVPNGGGSRGDPAADSDDSGSNCFVTQNGAGDTDVDGGPTRLVSPTFDLSGGSSHVVSYQWWFTNDDQDIDRLTVQISNNGGSTWTQVASHAGNAGGIWRTTSFEFEDFLPGTNNVRIRFNATDNPNDSVTEAGIDDVRIQSIECDGGETNLTGFSITRGTLLSGVLADLVDSDNAAVRARSGFGPSFTELHSMIAVVNAVTSVSNPGTIDVTVESRIDQPSGSLQMRLRNWNTSQFDLIGTFAVGSTDTVRVVNGVSAANYVDGSGAIDVQIRHIVFAPLFAFQFDSFVDQVELNVN